MDEEKGNNQLLFIVTYITKRIDSITFSVHFQVHLTAKLEQSE